MEQNEELGGCGFLLAMIFKMLTKTWVFVVLVVFALLFVAAVSSVRVDVGDIVSRATPVPTAIPEMIEHRGCVPSILGLFIALRVLPGLKGGV